MKDVKNNSGLGLLHVGSVSADGAAAIYADLAGFEGALIIYTYEVDTGSAGNGITLKVYEADLAPTTPAAIASYSEVAATDLRGTFVETAATDGIQSVCYVGSQRYITVYFDEGGTAIQEAHVSVLGLRNGVAVPAPAVTTGAITS